MEGDEVNEEEIVDEFRRFLDKVSAEDFAEVEDGEEAEREEDSSGVQLALDQREQLDVERAQALVAQRAGVLAHGVSISSASRAASTKSMPCSSL